MVYSSRWLLIRASFGWLLPTDIGVHMSIVFLVLSPAPAQQRVDQGGHALDASLRLGSDGYNRRTGGQVRGRQVVPQRHRYGPSMSSSPYVVTRNGTMRHSPTNAFAPRSSYRPTGYSSEFSHANDRRFRYQGY